MLKGVVVLVAFMGIATVFQLNTMLWIFKNAINVGILAVIILFQPELRRALEELGRKNIISEVLIRDDRSTKDGRINDHTISELIAAAMAMSKNKTGALIVVEKDFQLKEYERTGIALDSLVSSQLLINIFEKNTPLHDGAIIVRGDRVVSATCYLPLSDNMELDKGLGTRHRAAVGISEVSDSMTIIVSEETGSVSVAEGGRIERSLDEQKLRELLMGLQKAQYGENKMQQLKRRLTHAAKNSEDNHQ